MTYFMATKDQGRIHIGFYNEDTPTYQLGRSINAYNNFLTQFVTRLLGLSIDIEIAGKMRAVNKKSFSLHLESIGQNSKIVPAYYNSLFVNPPRNTSQLLSDSLSQRKQNKLFQLMIMAIKKNEVEIAQELVRKGASIDRPFFLSEVHHTIRYDEASMRNFILSQLPVQPHFSRYTPLSYAAYMNSNLTHFFSTLNKSAPSTKTHYSVYQEKPLATYRVNLHTQSLIPA